MEFRILGTFQALDGERELPLGGGRQRAVLAILLIHRGSVVSADHLIELLWGERPPATAAKTVQVYVSRLRKELGEGMLLTRGGGYVLEVPTEHLDAARFEQLLDQARDAAGPKQTAGLLRAALDLWRGPPLAEFAYEAFARDEIDRLDERRLGAVEDHADAQLALAHHREIVAELEMLVRAHPTRERLRGQLMLALYRSGRQADALASYQQARKALDEQLGLDPGPELRGLERAILDQDPALGARYAVRRPRRPSRRGVLIAAALGALAIGAVVLTRDSAGPSVHALMARGCSPIAGTSPDGLIVADLPLSGDFRSLGAEMDASIRYLLGRRGFRAGRHRVGYQVCNEGIGDDAVDDQARCAANARAYARNRSVIAVVGPFSSACASVQIPVTNRAGLAMVSPTNTYVGLTHAGPSAAIGEPETLYPTGHRTYARVVADDGIQAAAIALLAKRLGIRRLFLLRGDPAGTTAFIDGVGFAAERVGVGIVGRDAWQTSAQSFEDLTARVGRSRPDGVLLAGALVENEGLLIRDLRRRLPHARLLASDGFAATDALVDAAGSSADGMTVMLAGKPPAPAFLTELADHLGVTPEPYSIYAAQSLDLALHAIARSDGTRASVVHELFSARLRDGIVGELSLTRNGDPAAPAVSAYRVQGGRQRLLMVLAPSDDLQPASG